MPDAPANPLHRRDFLRLGSLAFVGALLPAGCAGYHALLREEEETQLKFLSAKDYAILLAAADALLPDEAPYPSHRDLGTALMLDHELAQWETVRSKDVPTLLRLIEHGTVMFGYSFTRFTRLSVAERRDYLAGWGESSFNFKRASFLALKGLLAFYYFSHPKVWPAIGYDGPWMGRFDIPILPVEGLPA